MSEIETWESPHLSQRARRLRAWLPWALPYLLAFAGFTAARYTRDLPFADWMFLATFAVPLVTSIVAAIVDGRWKTYRWLLFLTWSTGAAEAAVLLHSTRYRWMHFGHVDMGPIILPFFAVALASGSLAGAAAFALASRLRDQRPRKG